MKKTTIIIIAVVVILGLWVGVKYNSLVTARESIDAQWSQVQAQYQRRFDLIPNVVNAVKGAMKQETAIFTQLANARAQYLSAKTPADQEAAAQSGDQALSKFLAVIENYPQLKSIDADRDLIVELEGTENRIGVERKKYNETVKEYNLGVSRFPGSIIAGIFNFDIKEYLKADAAAQTAPKVDLTN